MQKMNQNIIQKNLFRALIPGKELVDSRKESDYLNYLIGLSSVINFYDQENRLNGSWQPFLLKDPVFLLIAITKYDISNFSQLLSKIRLSKNSLIVPADNNEEKYHDLLNSIFSINYSIYRELEKWSGFMQADNTDYKVKYNTISGIERKFSKIFWAIVGLNKFIVNTYPLWNVKHPDSFRDEFSTDLWRTNMDKEPFFDVLKLNDGFNSSFSQIFDSLHVVTNDLIQFVQLLIDEATTDLSRVSSLKSNHPDTLLLRVIVKLLLKQKEAINTISSRHLDFYYREILGQIPCQAEPDTVFVDVHSGLNQIISLTKGTVFNGGTDLNSNAVNYISTTDCQVNPAVITGVQSVYKKKLESNKYQLFSTSISNFDKVTKNENGYTNNWSAFGSQNGDPLVTSFVCASPLLFLPGGNRLLTLRIKFNQLITLKDFDQASYFISTTEEWMAYKPQHSFDQETNEVVSTFKFDPDFPAITRLPFIKSGVQTNWPLLRIDFNQFYEDSIIPGIEYLIIENSVEKAKDIILYNQNGLISSMPGMQLFGTNAVVKSNLVLGSAEIFSKPVTELDITFKWGKLPANFFDYYYTYNYYLSQSAPILIKNSLIPNFLISWGGSIIRKLFKKKFKQESTTISEGYFNNRCFKVGFQVLDNGDWTSYKLRSVGNALNISAVNSGDKKKNSGEKEEDLTCFLYPAENDNDLFLTTRFDVLRPDDDVSKKVIINGQANLQNGQYSFSENSSHGFSRLYLDAPGHGFGSDIYPAVVAYTATQNGLVIAQPKGITIPPELLANPQVPFIPTAEDLEIKYKAYQKYEFKELETYPIQLFYFTPFTKFKIYDNDPEGQASVCSNGFSINGNKVVKSEFPLYPTFSGNGTLFLGLQKLITPTYLSMYFEVASSIGQIDLYQTSIQTMSSTGWNEVVVVEDGTNSLSSTGIITLLLPEDIVTNSFQMPNGLYWVGFTNENSNSWQLNLSYINTNGVKLERKFSPDIRINESFHLQANKIVLPPATVPGLTSVCQPFPSFGGKPDETEIQMNQRVAIDIGTKGQLVCRGDYFKLITTKFPEIYYCKVVKERKGKGCNLFLVGNNANDLWASPFLPLISNSLLAEVNDYVAKRTSIFANVMCAAFGLEEVKFKATITINSSVGSDFAKADINNRLNYYLSPWTSTVFSQISIDSPIYIEEVIRIITELNYVKMVNTLIVQTATSGSDLVNLNSGNAIIPSQQSLLFVSAKTHDLTIKVEL